MVKWNKQDRRAAMGSVKLWCLVTSCMYACVVVSDSQQYLETSLLNTANVQGDNITLMVRGGYYIRYGHWEECITAKCKSIGRRDQVYYGSNSTRGSRYQLSYQRERPYEVTQLTLLDALLEDGGLYTYRGGLGRLGQLNTEVVMLESHPMCSRNTSDRDVAFEGDVIMMSCQARYQGRWALLMEWMENGYKISPSDVTNATVVGARNVPGLAKYSVSMTARRQLNGAVYSMEAFFAPIGLNITSNGYDFQANNTPSYNYTFQFRPLKVKYTDHLAGNMERGGEDSDSAIIAAALVPTLLLVLCGVAFVFLFWKYRRLSVEKNSLSREISANAERTPHESLGTRVDESDAGQLAYEPLRIDSTGPSSGAAEVSPQDRPVYENMAHDQPQEVTAIYEIPAARNNDNFQ